MYLEYNTNKINLPKIDNILKSVKLLKNVFISFASRYGLCLFLFAADIAVFQSACTAWESVGDITHYIGWRSHAGCARC